jgi:hypothetical protein
MGTRGRTYVESQGGVETAAERYRNLLSEVRR